MDIVLLLVHVVVNGEVGYRSCSSDLFPHAFANVWLGLDLRKHHVLALRRDVEPIAAALRTRASADAYRVAYVEPCQGTAVRRIRATQATNAVQLCIRQTIGELD